MSRNSEFLDEINRAPLSYGILLIYLIMAGIMRTLSPSGEQLVQYGAAVPLLVMDGEIWRLVSHAFLHGGLIHLGFNTYALYVLGPALESRLGSPRFALLYFVGAVSGGVLAMLWGNNLSIADQDVPLVGGSGALFAMLGAILAMNIRGGRHFLDFLNYQGPRQLLLMIGANLVLGYLIPFVSNSAHIGGMIAGFVLIFCFLERRRDKPDQLARTIQAGWVVLFCSLIFYVANPVLRQDYQIKRLILTRDRDEQLQLEQMLPWTLRQLEEMEEGKIPGNIHPAHFPYFRKPILYLLKQR